MTNIKHIYWDLDGTLYRFHPNANSVCSRSAAKAAVQSGAQEPEDEIFDHYLRVYDPHILPESLNGKDGFDRHRFHHLYHDGIDLKQIVEPVAGVTEAFAQANVGHVLVTHGSRPWAQRALKAVGLHQVFEDDHIFCLEDMNFSGQGASPRAYLDILQQLGHQAHQVAMVEDSAKNLIYAHQLGMTTFLLRHDSSAGEQLPYVTHQVSHVSEVFKTLGLRVAKPPLKQANKLDFA